MSFAMTTDQIRNRTKTVTRRYGWYFLKPGDVVHAVVKSMGLKKGEKVESLGHIQIISTRKERLNKITKNDCIREGFPEMEPADFIKMLKDHYSSNEWDLVNRIEFAYLGEPLARPDPNEATPLDVVRGGRWRSQIHLENIEQLPCAVTEAEGRIQAHHIKGIGHFSAAGRKAGDHMAMPLDYEIHKHLHEGKDDNAKELVRLQPLLVLQTLNTLIESGQLTLTAHRG